MTETPGRWGLAVLAVVALFVTPAAALALPADQPQIAQQDNETVLPGERLSGVVGVQGAEVDSAVEGRAFGQAVANAASNETKAAVVADRVDRLETRLADLQDEREQLRSAFENGSISEGAYQARMASLAARIDGVQRQLNHSQAVTATLPEPARQAAGLDADRVENLRSQAGQMRGGEVAAAARSVAGRGVGAGVPDSRGGGPPEGIPGGPNHPGPPDEAGPPGNSTGGPPGDDAGGPPGDDAGGPPSDEMPAGENAGGPGENASESQSDAADSARDGAGSDNRPSDGGASDDRTGDDGDDASDTATAAN